MTAQRRAALELQRRQHYGLDGPYRKRPRRRFRPVLAGVAAIVFAFICLLARCSAEMRTITVSGQFTEAQCLWWWGEDHASCEHPEVCTPVFLDLPVSYVFTVVYDDEVEAEYEDPSDPNFARYLTPNGSTTLEFNTPWGWQTIALDGSEVHVRKNQDGLKGVSFGNLWWDSDDGLFYPQYFGLYCSFLIPTGWSVTVSDDSLSQVESLQNSSLLRVGSYCYHQGFNDPFDPEFEVILEDNTIAYSVE